MAPAESELIIAPLGTCTDEYVKDHKSTEWFRCPADQTSSPAACSLFHASHSQCSTTSIMLPVSRSPCPAPNVHLHASCSPAYHSPCISLPYRVRRSVVSARDRKHEVQSNTQEARLSVGWRSEPSLPDAPCPIDQLARSGLGFKVFWEARSEVKIEGSRKQGRVGSMLPRCAQLQALGRTCGCAASGDLPAMLLIPCSSLMEELNTF